jgi:hypothetical protein
MADVPPNRAAAPGRPRDLCIRQEDNGAATQGGIRVDRQHLRRLVRHFPENGLKVLLENPGNVRDLLQLLDVQVVPRIDFTHMQTGQGAKTG